MFKTTKDSMSQEELELVEAGLSYIEACEEGPVLNFAAATLAGTSVGLIEIEHPRCNRTIFFTSRDEEHVLSPIFIHAIIHNMPGDLDIGFLHYQQFGKLLSELQSVSNCEELFDMLKVSGKRMYQCFCAQELFYQGIRYHFTAAVDDMSDVAVMLWEHGNMTSMQMYTIGSGDEFEDELREHFCELLALCRAEKISPSEMMENIIESYPEPSWDGYESTYN